MADLTTKTEILKIRQFEEKQIVHKLKENSLNIVINFKIKYKNILFENTT